MNLKSKSDKRNFIIIALCAVLVVMGVGYAAFSSLLTINGTANITNSWCVGFDNANTTAYTTKTGITGGTAPTGSINFSGSTCGTKYQPDASLTATFKQPGDEVEYTLTIKNKSTVPVAIKSILVENNSVTTDTTIKKGNIEFIVHMPESTNLAVDAETTMRVVARFQNTTDVTGVYNGEEQSLNVKINAEQGTGIDGMTTTYTGTVYRHNTNYVYNGVNIVKSYVYSDSNGSMKNGNMFNSLEDCQAQYPDNGDNTCKLATNVLGSYTEDASTLNKTYYLKHEIVEDVLTNSYVCFISDKEHCMKGGNDGASFEVNSQIIKDFQIFYNLNSISNPSSSKPGCYFYSSISYCYGGDFNQVRANSSGNVYVYGSSSEICFVSGLGNSFCSG